MGLKIFNFNWMPNDAARTGVLSTQGLTASVIWHAFALLGLGSLYRSGGEHIPPTAAEPPEEIAFVVFPQFQPPSSPRLENLASADADPPPVKLEAATAEPTSPSALLDTAFAAPPSTSGLTTATSLLRPGFTDPRLFAEPRRVTPEAPRRLSDRFAESLGAAMISADDSLAAERRRERHSNRIQILGRGVTIFGDSANAHWRGLIVGNRRMTLPVDGREWEDLEMKRQRDGFVRDSILRARSAATRARIDAQRKGRH